MVARLKEFALFDLDGTLVDLKIDPDEFERLRSFWASYLTSVGVPTTLRPLLPELRRIAQTPLESGIKQHILRSFDDLELACEYCCLGKLETILNACRSQFRKLALVTHNSSAFWNRLAREHTWPHLFDAVTTRNDMTFFKPDPRVCESVFRELTPIYGSAECWVIGNSEADRDLGLNLRQEYPSMTVRTIMVGSTSAARTLLPGEPEVSLKSVDGLLDLLQEPHERRSSETV